MNFYFSSIFLEMSTRIKDSQRQKMLIDYVKNGIVPDGFYVKTMKDGRVQFRRVKQPATIEVLLHKIHAIAYL